MWLVTQFYGQKRATKIIQECEKNNENPKKLNLFSFFLKQTNKTKKCNIEK